MFEYGLVKKKMNNNKNNLKYVGILFADIRGYSKLSGEEISKFHHEYLPNLWNKVIQEIEPELKGAKTWGDGITCVSEDIIKLSDFSLKLASSFDKKGWKANIYHPLRLRTALHTGFLYPSEDRISSNKIEQYTGVEMVKPARLEPVVRPGQVWCTHSFKMAVLERVDNDISRLNFLFDDLAGISFAKNYGSYPVHRIRFRRGDHEEELQKYETKMIQAQKFSDREGFIESINLLLNATSHDFVFLSKYLSWYEVVRSMVDMRLYKEAENIIREFREYVDKKGWLSEEIEVHLSCLLANCVSHRHDANIQDLSNTLHELERLSNTKRDEVSILIAETYKQMGMALIHSNEYDIQRSILLNSYNQFFEIFTKKISKNLDYFLN